MAILRKHGIPYAQLAIIKSMPVDGRHNSKIDRAALIKTLAKNQLRTEALL